MICRGASRSLTLAVCGLLLAAACSANDVPGEGALSDSEEAPADFAVLRQAVGLPTSREIELLEVASYELRVEEAIADCMRTAGFEYTPVVVPGEDRVKITGAGLSSFDYASSFGFGISTGFSGAARNEVDNPNLAQFDLLEPAAQRRFVATLEGEAALDARPTETVEIGGCRLEAETAVPLPPWYLHGDWITESAIELNERLAANRDVVDLYGDWSDCMAQAGFPGLTSPPRLIDDLATEFEERVLANLVTARPFADEGDFLDALDDTSRVLLEDFVDEEIRIAVSSHTCLNPLRSDLQAHSEAMQLEIAGRANLEGS